MTLEPQDKLELIDAVEQITRLTTAEAGDNISIKQQNLVLITGFECINRILNDSLFTFKDVQDLIAVRYAAAKITLQLVEVDPNATQH